MIYRNSLFSFPAALTFASETRKNVMNFKENRWSLIPKGTAEPKRVGRQKFILVSITAALSLVLLTTNEFNYNIEQE